MTPIDHGSSLPARQPPVATRIHSSRSTVTAPPAGEPPPDAGRAASLAAEASAPGLASSPVSAVLDLLAAALCVVDVERRVRYMNRAAHEITASGSGIALRDGMLWCERPVQTGRLQQALSAVCARRLARDAFVLSCPGQDSPLQISVSGLAGCPASDPQSSTLALVAASRPHASGHDLQTLRAMFGLTGSEAAILNGLLGGLTLEQCARARGVAVSTARSQLSSILGKTNTTTQAQLMIVAKALPATRPAAAAAAGATAAALTTTR